MFATEQSRFYWLGAQTVELSKQNTPGGLRDLIGLPRLVCYPTGTEAEPATSVATGTAIQRRRGSSCMDHHGASRYSNPGAEAYISDGDRVYYTGIITTLELFCGAGQRLRSS
jgi:hypothetical protein